jgi:outer membrane protein TolC
VTNQGRTTFFWLFALAFLAGCTTVGPDYERPAVELPAQYPVAPADAQVSVHPEWWTLFQDRTLDELVSAARKSNATCALPWRKCAKPRRSHAKPMPRSIPK